jgi:FAD/FMN-containing dehydrogenase
LPAAVVVPSSEDDVVGVIKYAAANGLKIIPVGGQLAGFVVVNGKCIYLDMKKLAEVKVETRNETVTVGGSTRW